MIGEVEALLEQRVDVGGPCSPEPSRECSSMFLTMESARLPCCTTFSRLPFSSLRQLADFLAHLPIERAGSSISSSSSIKLGRKRREIIDEIERVLDLVRDAGGELAERGELLGLDQAVLRGAQIVERCGQLPGALLHLVEQPHVLDGDHGLVGECRDELDLPFGERLHVRAG